ncbi:MAG: hypothetical protein ABEJ76_04890 [Halanaeroarchaeum sp.]
MGLSEIAAGLAVTEDQRDRGVATVDRTAPTLNAAVARYAEDLPCEAETAAMLVDDYAGGASVGEAAAAAGLAAVTAAKTLHLLGFEGLSPLSPLGRDVLRDWLAAEIGRADARALAGASEVEFALATFVETHAPLSGAAERVTTALQPGASATVEKRDALADTMSGVDELE